jgi:hypothetical protein
MNLSPVTHELLRQRLRNATVQFAFKKLDGTLRIAIGTTNLSSIPLDRHPLGVRESPANVITFFDLEKSAWRRLSTSVEVFLA